MGTISQNWSESRTPRSLYYSLGFRAEPDKRYSHARGLRKNFLHIGASLPLPGKPGNIRPIRNVFAPKF